MREDQCLMNEEEEEEEDVGTLVDPSSATIALILLISFCFTDLFSLFVSINKLKDKSPSTSFTYPTQ